MEGLFERQDLRSTRVLLGKLDGCFIRFGSAVAEKYGVKIRVFRQKAADLFLGGDGEQIGYMPHLLQLLLHSLFHHFRRVSEIAYGNT